MSDIIPTEEQKQAAREISAKGSWGCWCSVDVVAQLLAEREAKLRGEYQSPTQDVVIDTLRARVAELEEINERLREQLDQKFVQFRRDADRKQQLEARVAELESRSKIGTKNFYALADENAAIHEREAQHLADIREVKEFISSMQYRILLGIEVRSSDFDDVTQRLAHYDEQARDGGEG